MLKLKVREVSEIETMVISTPSFLEIELVLPSLKVQVPDAGHTDSKLAGVVVPVEKLPPEAEAPEMVS